MSATILKINDFRKAYPKLYDKINEIRQSTGSECLEKEYNPDYFHVPIRMHDAALAESCLKKLNDAYNPKEVLGFIRLQKILNAVETEPNMMRWIDILYYPNNPRGLYTDRYNEEIVNKPKKYKYKQKEPNSMAKIRNKVDGEVILTVGLETEGNKYTAYDKDGTDRTAEVNQKKLKYAYDNHGVVRGRLNSTGEMVWRVVKEKYVKSDKPETEATVAPTAASSVVVAG